MLICRLLLSLCITLLAGHQLAAQNTPINPAASLSENAAASPEPRITFNYVHVNGPYVALTFDDGPSAKLTPKLLDLLAARRVKATFFVIGQNVIDYPDIVKRAAREGHEIGNHTWSHPYLAKMSDEAVRRELRRTDDAIKDAIGTRPTLMRPPYGSITPRQKHWIHDEFGYEIILWDVDPLDWKRPGPMAVCNRIVKESRPGSIVLSHDIHPGTVEAMPATFAQLESKGFKFFTVSELIQMAQPEAPSPTSADKMRNSDAETSPAPAAARTREQLNQAAAAPNFSPGER